MASKWDKIKKEHEEQNKKALVGTGGNQKK